MAKNIGLFGFGVVGKGYYTIAKNHRPDLLPQHIVVQNKDKQRTEDLNFSYDPSDILEKDCEIGIELISDPRQAFEYVSTLLRSGKKVISANKKMIAAHLPEIIQLEKEHGGSLLYEASAAAGIPIITCLDEHFTGDTIHQLEGILNGSSNYILTQLFEKELDFDQAVRLAQEKGFAEADPTLDINGSDVASKLTILTLHAFGRYIPESALFTYGIQHLSKQDVVLAKSLGLKIKLVAKAKAAEDGLQLLIMPAFVSANDALFLVKNEYNAVKIISRNLGEQCLQGKGAGSLPTGASVYADLIRADKGLSYAYDKLKGAIPTQESPKQSFPEVLLRAEAFTTLEKLVPNGEIFSVAGGYCTIASLSSAELKRHQTYLDDCKVSITALNGAISRELLLDKLQQETTVLH